MIRFCFGTFCFTSCCWAILASCKRPYEPAIKRADTSPLVVEGFIQGDSPFNIRLSHVRSLTAGDTASRNYELNANVAVEDDHQNIYPLADSGNGNYARSVPLNLDPSYQYRLHIVTSGAKEYISDFVPFKSATPIDTIPWQFKDGGVQVSLNTHDPSNQTVYYRWEYTETWQFHVKFMSFLIYDPQTITFAPRQVPVYTCWRSDFSTNILLASTEKLSTDVVNERPLVYIPNHDQKLSVLYSMLATQYPLDIKAYNYWTAMSSNSEKTGSIFDPQPNQTKGNIHSLSDPLENVVGFISAGNISQKRIFIDNALMPYNWNSLVSSCTSKIIPNNIDSIRAYFGGEGVPIVEQVSNGVVTGYVGTPAICGDCRVQGTNVKPSFWP